MRCAHVHPFSFGPLRFTLLRKVSLRWKGGKALPRPNGCAVHALRARPPFSAHVRVQRICITRNNTSMAAAHTAMPTKPHR